MNKKYPILSLFITTFLMPLYAPHRHSLNVKKINEGTAITRRDLNNFYHQRYQKEFVVFTQAADAFMNTLNTFAQRVDQLSQQPRASQENTATMQDLTQAIATIKPKKLLIALVKLMQFKQATSQKNIVAVNKYLDQISNILHTLSNTLATLSTGKSFTANVISPLSFKTKKIKRAIINWNTL